MDEHCCKLSLGFIRPPCSVGASSFCTFAICGSACSHAKRQQAFGIRLHRLLQANSPLLLKASLTIVAERPGPRLTAANPPRCCLCREPGPSPARHIQSRCHAGNFPGLLQTFAGSFRGQSCHAEGKRRCGASGRPLPGATSSSPGVCVDPRFPSCTVCHFPRVPACFCHLP